MYSPIAHIQAATLTLPANRKGRDFILGDLHGQYKALMALLRFAKFSPRTDRLFSVGDLIDRGPDSSKCLRLLNRRWFSSVLGNHDIAFLLHLAQDTENISLSILDFCKKTGGEGGRWYLENDRRDLLPLGAKLNFLPHIITVGDDRPDFHVVHASLIPFAVGRPFILTDQELSIYETSADQDVMILSLISERDLWRESLPHRAAGLAPVYCGHSIVPAPRWSLSHLNVDSGAGYYSAKVNEYRLTMACHQTKELWSVSVADPRKVARCHFPKMKKNR